MASFLVALFVLTVFIKEVTLTASARYTLICWDAYNGRLSVLYCCWLSFLTVLWCLVILNETNAPCCCEVRRRQGEGTTFNVNVNGGHQGGHVYVMCGDYSKMHVTTDKRGAAAADNRDGKTLELLIKETTWI